MIKNRVIILILVSIGISITVNAQVIIMTVSALSQSADKKLMKNLKGDWNIARAEINGEDVMSEFEGVRLRFPKCKGKDYKSGNCPHIEVYNDENTDYFKGLFGDDATVTITSRKEINKAAKAEDAEYEKVKYEIVEAKGSEYEFAFKYRKGKVTIETVGADESEYFELVRPPKEKKKKK